MLDFGILYSFASAAAAANSILILILKRVYALTVILNRQLGSFYNSLAAFKTASVHSARLARQL